tara:strand:+ start:320 stop:1189 length:870 start_codon:yes stop_codon:yes gene_type:complete
MNQISKNQICFVFIRDDLASSKVRGKQIADKLQLPCFKFSLEKALSYKIIIYVKLLPSLEEMKILNEDGIIQIVDLLDNYNERNINKRTNFIDSFIAASMTHKVWIQERFKKKAYIIPHHHYNSSGKKNTVKRNGPLSIGYVGDKQYWKYNKHIERFQEHKIIKDIDYDNLHSIYSSLDIASAARGDKQKLSLNSNLKLLNYMSYGIPCVASPESSYLEIARHGEECLFAQNNKEFLSFTDLLLNDYELRLKISENAYKSAKKYDISNIIKIYKKIISQYEKYVDQNED